MVSNHVRPPTPFLLTISLPAGLSRLEYRGYDSAGLAVDGDKKNEVLAFKEVGKVAKLKKLIEDEKPDLTKVFDSHAGIAHTRWATHGTPSRLNCHPHRSDASWQFSVVHNGIITNYKELRVLLESKVFRNRTHKETLAHIFKRDLNLRPRPTQKLFQNSQSIFTINNQILALRILPRL